MTTANDTLYYFWAHNSSGDSYYGYTIADTGTYSTSHADYWLGTYDNDGGYWLYDVYATANYGYNTGWEGYSTVDPSYSYYYDAGTGTYNSETYTANWGGLGSEYGQLSTGSHEYFGYYGYYEADQSTGTDSVYYFWAHNSSGDSYYGYTIADTGTYSTSHADYWLGTYDNDGGYWLYDVYATANYGYNTGWEGYSTVDPSYSYYYDAGTGTYNSETYTANWGGLGSEYGQLSTGSHEYFGYYGYYEADLF